MSNKQSSVMCVDALLEYQVAQNLGSSCYGMLRFRNFAKPHMPEHWTGHDLMKKFNYA